jgi:excisionase family DNA binding protein
MAHKGNYSNADGERIALSIEQAAEMVDLSRATFLKLVYSGEIPSKMIGRRRLIPTAGLKAWANEGIEPNGSGSRAVTELLDDETLTEATNLQLQKALSATIDQTTLDELRSRSS